MNTKAGLSMTKIVIIAIVGMVIGTIVLFLLLPYFDEKFGEPGPCDDTSYFTEGNDYITVYKDSEHPNRQINYYPNGPSDAQPNDHWQYNDGFEGFISKYFQTLHQLRQATEAEYEGNRISEGSWHWFNCTAEAIS